MSTHSAEAERPCAVLVVGEALVDVVEVVGKPVTEHVGGSPANVALGLGRLGVDVRLHTALARDARGKTIEKHLASSGVIIDDASWTLMRTSTARALIGQDGGATYEFDLDWQLPTPPVWRGEEIVHVGSIAAFLRPGAERVIELVRALYGRAALTFDPNIRPALVGDHRGAIDVFENIASHAQLVKLSDEDAAWLYPGMSADDISHRVRALGAEAVVITRGADGALGFAGAARVAVPAPRVAVTDTVGAGDTFMAALIDGLVSHGLQTSLADESLFETLVNAAIAAASITVQRLGADLPDRSEVEFAERRLAIKFTTLSHPPTFIS